MTERISKILKSLVSDLLDKEIEQFLDICKPTTLKKNANFIMAGQTPRKFGFIIKGLVRYFYIDNEGREFTKAFLGDNSFIGSYTAMKNQTQSFYSVQALAQTEIFELNFEQWEKLKNANEIWNKLLIALLEKGYSIKEKRERELLLLDAENRYKIFREDFHMYETDIKQHLIASYIGITPIALSRIRKKMGLINLC